MAPNIRHGKYDDIWLDRELRDIIAAIATLSQSSTSTVGSTSIFSGSGGSSGTEIRHGIVALVAGSQTLTFSTPMPSNAYTLPRLRCYATDTGVYEDVEASISSKTISGFTISVIKDCTCEYVALY